MDRRQLLAGTWIRGHHGGERALLLQACALTALASKPAEAQKPARGREACGK